MPVNSVSAFLDQIMGFSSHRGRRPKAPHHTVRSYRRRLRCEPLEPRRLLSGDNAAFVSQTLAAGASEYAGEFFTQTWTMENTGTTTWSSGTSGYTLNIVGTDVLGVTSATPDTNSGHIHPLTVINGGGTVAPGATATFTMYCIAPETAGTYTDTFQLNGASGDSFGPQVTVQIVVSQSGPSGEYDRARAVSYANNYAGYVVTDGYFWTSGSGYTYYGAGAPVPTNLTGDDCAHFVSSCIGSPATGLGGGLTIASRVPPTYGEPGADHLVNTTLIGGGLAVKETSASSLLPGDVVGWYWYTDGVLDTSLDHDTIYLGNGQLAAHANTHLDVPFSYYASTPGVPEYAHIKDATATHYISLSDNLTSDSIAAGNVDVGSSDPLTLTIFNGGNSALTVTSISYPSGFSGNWSGTIPADSDQNVTVTFSPTAAGSYGGTVTVNSNALGTNTIAISGIGVKITTTAAVVRSSGTPTYGQALTFTATVTPASGSGETGTVQFQIDGSNVGSPVSLSGNTATYTTSALTAVNHSIVAVYSGDGKFTGSTSSTLSQTVGTATLTITADWGGKTYGTVASFSSTAFAESGLVTANGDSITGVTESCAGCPAAAPVGSYSIVPSDAAGTGLANYNITYVSGNLTVAQAASLSLTTGKLVVATSDNLADGCDITIGSFPALAMPVLPAAAAAAAAPASTGGVSTDSAVADSPVVFPHPNRSHVTSIAADFGPRLGVPFQSVSSVAAVDAVMAEYAYPAP